MVTSIKDKYELLFENSSLRVNNLNKIMRVLSSIDNQEYAAFVKLLATKTMEDIESQPNKEIVERINMIFPFLLRE